MRLFVRLLYILLAIFVAGIVMLVLVPSASVMSRVATGLVTGSFVGWINALTNYYHLRQTYFENLVDFINRVSNELERDYTNAKARNMFIRDMSKSEMISYAAEHEDVMEKMKQADEMKARYENVLTKFDSEAFIPLWPLGKNKVAETLDELDRLMFNVRHLYAEYRMCHDFTLLSANVSKEEQEIAIGDPDEFYEFVVQNNVDYQDRIAFTLNELTNLGKELLKNGKHCMSKTYQEMLTGIIDIVREAYLKDAVIRDVIHERAAEVMDEGDENVEQEQD